MGKVLINAQTVHVVFRSSDFFLAGLVEMELNKWIGCSTDGDAAAGVVANLDGMAIVDDFQRDGLVIELDGLKAGVFLGASDVDG